MIENPTKSRNTVSMITNNVCFDPGLELEPEIDESASDIAH